MYSAVIVFVAQAAYIIGKNSGKPTQRHIVVERTVHDSDVDLGFPNVEAILRTPITQKFTMKNVLETSSEIEDEIERISQKYNDGPLDEVVQNHDFLEKMKSSSMPKTEKSEIFSKTTHEIKESSDKDFMAKNVRFAKIAHKINKMNKVAHTDPTAVLTTEVHDSTVPPPSPENLRNTEDFKKEQHAYQSLLDSLPATSPLKRIDAKIRNHETGRVNVTHADIVATYVTPPDFSKPEYKHKLSQKLPYCFELMNLTIAQRQVRIPSHLASGNVDLNWEYVENEVDQDIEDGCWTPNDCIPDQHLTFVVPYRDREDNLKILALHIHNYLKRQKRSYCLVLADQHDHGHFNRAKLMNVGYLEGRKHRYWLKKGVVPDCFAFHDVDLMPDHAENLYICHPEFSVHQCDKYDKYEYATQYNSGNHVSAGGALLVSTKQYEKVNGHPNWYWGWGVEDIDMSIRLRHTPANETEDFENAGLDYDKMPIGAKFSVYKSVGLTMDGGGEGFTRQAEFGRYTQIRHQHGFTNGPIKVKMFNEFGDHVAKYQIGVFRKERRNWDGHKTCVYRNLNTEYRKLYTKFTVDIRPAITLSLKLEMQDIQVLDIQPDSTKNNKDNCKFVKFANVTYGKATHGGITSKNHVKPLEERHLQGVANCLGLNGKHGQCNLVSMVQYWVPVSIPYPLVSTSNFSVETPGKWDSFIRSCPHTLAWFQAVEEPVLLKLMDRKPAELKYKLN